jgi:hypothetical protein
MHVHVVPSLALRAKGINSLYWATWSFALKVFKYLETLNNILETNMTSLLKTVFYLVFYQALIATNIE